MPPHRTQRFPLLAYPAYVRFWIADTVSKFGTHITALAMQVLAVLVLDASATDLGLINAARWVPYLALGLFAGVLADRVRRRPLLIISDLGRGVLLLLIPLLALASMLTIPALVVFMVAFGVLTLMFDAAYQSYLPRLVPGSMLMQANARLEQAGNVAGTTGPMLAGGLVKLVGAPFAMLIDSVSYLVSGIVLITIKGDEPKPTPSSDRHLFRELREGLAYVYRHPMLAPAALTSHARFAFANVVSTVSVLYILRDLDLGAFGLGVTYAFAGAGAVIGGALSQWTGVRFGVGRTVVVTRAAAPVAFALLPLATAGVDGWVLACTAQFIWGLAAGIESPNEIGYRQSITPDRLQGRMNATIRSLNWGMITVGAPVGGILADTIGYRPALWTGVAGMAVAAVALSVTKFRHARVTDAPATVH